MAQVAYHDDPIGVDDLLADHLLVHQPPNLGFVFGEIHDLLGITLGLDTHLGEEFEVPLVGSDQVFRKRPILEERPR